MIYSLTGLHCGACVTRVTGALQGFADKVEVTLSPMQATLINPKSGANMADMQAALTAVGKYEIQTQAQVKPWLATYYPLLLILAFVLGVSVLAQATPTLHDTMRYFMAGFFLCFAFFKLLDIHAFARAYSGYDLLAKRWQTWGHLYPFVELGLGIAYLTNWQPLLTHGLTIVVMGFSALGVINAVRKQEKIQCACLGTVFQLPMSVVTIIEDVGMVVMAALMLFFS